MITKNLDQFEIDVCLGIGQEFVTLLLILSLSHGAHGLALVHWKYEDILIVFQSCH